MKQTFPYLAVFFTRLRLLFVLTRAVRRLTSVEDNRTAGSPAQPAKAPEDPKSIRSAVFSYFGIRPGDLLVSATVLRTKKDLMRVLMAIDEGTSV